ncbi:thermonuclease family protein [Geminocystis sp. NIES-3709]|uniref:thermonuclease family protein n=1 Tax=Geminocystis sp. NIES-3709 TaxID=1617448 RepID=UPI0005FC7F21|nr:thermonuclease family protein [Geminocystis sp. NIES-3709]BAQ63930.1 nuclease [Geminocystis sp. NIES-3709]
MKIFKILLIISSLILFSCGQSEVKNTIVSNNLTTIKYPLYKVKQGSIYDGDTLRVISNNQELKIRFACIDTREIKQDGGIEDRDFLRSLLAKNNNQVMVHITDEDKYGRSVAELFLPNGKLVQEIQARAGQAFPYPLYKQDCPNWSKVEQAGLSAKKERLGVWSTNNPEYPWNWRRKNQ